MATGDDPRQRYKKELGRLEGAVDDGNVTRDDADAIIELLNALDADNPAYAFQVNGRTETKAASTIRNYCQRLRLAAVAMDGSLFDADTDRVNRLMGDFATGKHPIAPNDGYANNTLGQYQSSLKAFYRYYDGHDVDPEAIPVAAGDETSVDARDMFTVDEVEAMRDAIESPRERCLFELLAYTGQRLRAIQTLRLKDVDTEEGIFWLNTDADGLKGSEGKRPLLGANEYVYQWREYHPTGEPDDYLITPTMTSNGAEPGEMMSQSTIRYHLRKIADEAGVDKDVHPHIFRHYFTTIAKRDYGMDDAHIKRLRGDSPGSNVMETTYRHLTDEDTIEHAQAKSEGREPETESPLTPKVCPTCKTHLEPDAKACGRCGAVFTPDAKAAKDQMKEDMKKDYRDTDPDNKDDVEFIEEFDERLSDPEFKAALLEKLEES